MSDSVLASPDPVVRSAARWFWWIAGLSLVNTFLAHNGNHPQFVLGLGITAIADAMFSQAKAVAFLIDALAIGFFVLIGLQASRGKLRAFYLGLGVYALDALVYVYLQNWMPVIFHGVVAFFIMKGVVRLRQAGSAAANPSAASSAE